LSCAFLLGAPVGRTHRVRASGFIRDAFRETLAFSLVLIAS
jgi:hypothetical protein